MSHDVVTALRQALGADAVRDRLFDRLAVARDASLYRMVPFVVVRPTTLDDVASIFRIARQYGTHCTFRAAGTSLSGQAVTNGILVDIGHSWSNLSVLDNGDRLRVQPGVTGARANAALRPMHRRIGPDPASLLACKVGGIVANNASGMCCGTAQNSYHTVQSMRVLLANGTVIDTSHPDASQHLHASAPEIAQGIEELRDTVRANPALVERIRHKYRIKNTMGYSLNAFLDEDEPAAIIARLMIGSEGTLGFIDEVVFRTVADARVKHTAMLVYASIDDASHAVSFWRDSGAAAVELFDDASLRSLATLESTPPNLRIEMKGAAALLVEMHDTEPPAVVHDGNWTGWLTDARQQAELWRLRKGLMPTVGAMRPAGATMINEDVAVPPHHLATLVRSLQEAFARHGYDDGILFGHAKDGNLHFVIQQPFATDADVARYSRFMDDVASIVTGLDGSLKAEHGTGRNMAPFVALEWGSEAYDIMCKVKALLDPHCMLNPGVVINGDPAAHVQHIKQVPPVDAQVDACIECGFCEHVCPTRHHSLTPRQRIAMLRELQAVEPDSPTARQLQQAYDRAAIDSCAVDGICATVCPVGIDTGSFVKSTRQREQSSATRHTSAWLASHMGVVDHASRSIVSTVRAIAGIVGMHRLAAASNAAHRMVRALPVLYPTMGGTTQRVGGAVADADIVLLPACGSRWMARRNGTSSAELLAVLCERAGLRLATVDDAGSMCCGQLFDSKGGAEAAATVRTATAHALAATVPHDRPVVVDASTCAAALRDAAMQHTVYDVVGILRHVLMPRLTVYQHKQHVVLHPGCGTAKLRQVDDMYAIAAQCALRVTVPATASCCGMAGDAGMRDPAIVTSALQDLCHEINTTDAVSYADVDGWYSVNPTCEIALEHQLERRVETLLALVEFATRTL